MTDNYGNKIYFGVKAKPLAEQLDGELPDASIKEFQRDADALTRVYARMLITGREVRKARQFLGQRIMREINQYKEGK